MSIPGVRISCQIVQPEASRGYGILRVTTAEDGSSALSVQAIPGLFVLVHLDSGATARLAGILANGQHPELRSSHEGNRNETRNHPPPSA